VETKTSLDINVDRDDLQRKVVRPPTNLLVFEGDGKNNKPWQNYMEWQYTVKTTSLDKTTWNGNIAMSTRVLLTSLHPKGARMVYVEAVRP
jgi:hypothetical protein